MPAQLEVLFSPAEFDALRQRDLSATVCVVFDILRATSSMMTALSNGAKEIVPVAEISEALALRRTDAAILLAGERQGLRILREQTGGPDFDLGNSPREFIPEIVRGRRIAMTTTNGTRALRACAKAKAVMIGSFLGLDPLAAWIEQTRPETLLLVGAGTFEQTAYEDTLAAGALADRLWPLYQGGQIADSAFLARLAFQDASADLLKAMSSARNGRRLLANPALRDDVSFCSQRDTLNFVAAMTPSGVVQRA
jgi:2-phosphosulfolactate phosphatase